MDNFLAPSSAGFVLLVIMSYLPGPLRVANAAGPALLCEMPRDMKVHMLQCTKRILQPHVVTLLEKRSKRFFKGRDIVDALTDMCVEGSRLINNHVALTVMQVKEEDKNFTEYALRNCVNSTRYVMAYGDS
ncbi:uncharacterized protein LOC144119588 [Amblyomma americanum]